MYSRILPILPFILFFLLLSIWEARAAWRPSLEPRLNRWGRNAALALASRLCVLVIFPVGLMQVALESSQKHLGMLSVALPGPFNALWFKMGVAILGMDLFMYLQHRLMHRYRLFWRFHRVHHTDTELDISTGLRFHPLEALYTMAVKLLAVVFLGAHYWAVGVYEMLYYGALLLTHVNVNIPVKVNERLMRWVVTPQMHRIHHSDHTPETDSNFGFVFPFWDRFFESFRAHPASGDKKIVFGLVDFQDKSYQSAHTLLLLPFRSPKSLIKPKKSPATKKQAF